MPLALASISKKRRKFSPLEFSEPLGDLSPLQKLPTDRQISFSSRGFTFLSRATRPNSGEKKFRTAHDLMVTSKLCQKIDMFL